MNQLTNDINRAPVIGFVRYSQKIAFNGRKVARDVFEAEYFEYRFNIFKKITLKSFQQQTNTNFVLLLLHSENMPPIYKERFLQLEKTNSFLYNIFVEDTQESFDEALLNSISYLSFEKNTVVTFRIDNDDAVQNDFIEKLSGFLKDDFIGYCVSIPMMYRVKHITKQSYMMEEFYFPANAIGLAYVTDKKNYKTVLELGDHDLVNEENAMIVLPRSKNGGIMTINGENEINSIDKTRARILTKEGLDKYLKERNIDNIDLNCLRIFDKINTSSNFSLKNTISLFIPPVINLALIKIKNRFFS